MTEKILVIKIGATGDVIRTTTLLHLFPNAEITWITASYNKLILPQHHPALHRIVAIEELHGSGIPEEHFNRIISLDDDLKCASLASSISHDTLFGA
ncbi:MAG: glycosyltransferase family 9 protein, partial [Flavobacteriia bacterium]